MEFVELTPYPSGPNHFISEDAIARVRFAPAGPGDSRVVMHVKLTGSSNEMTYHPVDQGGDVIEDAKVSDSRAIQKFKQWLAARKALQAKIAQAHKDSRG